MMRPINTHILTACALLCATLLPFALPCAAEDQVPEGVDPALYRQALSGDAACQVALGLCYNSVRNNHKRDSAAAVMWFKKAADQGSADGQARLATAYYFGEGVRTDHVEAVRLLRLAAVQSNALAQFGLGTAYVDGKGVPKDEAEAFRWVTLAAEQGADYAQLSLAQMYRAGQGVPKNDAEAVKWYRRAAEQGETVCQWRLAELLNEGIGCPKDSVAALMWTELVASSGYTFATGLRDRLLKTLSPEEVAVAKRNATLMRTRFPGIVRQRTIMLSEQGGGAYPPPAARLLQGKSRATGSESAHP